MMRWFAALTGSAALIACGIVHGFWTDRWLPPVETAQAADRLETVPLELGEWDGEVIAVKSGEAGAGVAGCIRRRYVNRKTGAEVSLFLVCGRSGPVSIHTPEVCYGASGFMVGNKSRFEVNETGDNMWKTDAIRASATEETRLRLYWGWNGGNGWTASNDARLQFVGGAVLHKLYIVRELNSLNESSRTEPCEEFLRVLLPALRKTLFIPAS
ncbi:MAG TPA: exosortase-associated EpsI family protein [Gemmataceae bacterium]|nr:exosortase-associated EpsI family protein [Gemmataceae bacterium]